MLRQLQGAAGILNHLHCFYSGKVIKEPSATGVHQQRLPLHLHQLNHHDLLGHGDAKLLSDLGIGPTRITRVIGILKAYTTRVGSGPFPTELDDAVGKHLATRGQEFGATTGRPRRCGWIDLVALKRAVAINGISGLCITKLDVLDGLAEINVCVGYELRGERIDILPLDADDIVACVPIYETFPGWQESTFGATRWTVVGVFEAGGSVS